MSIGSPLTVGRDIVIPREWILNDDGIYKARIHPAGEDIFIAGPVCPIAYVEDPKTGKWSLRIELINEGGKKAELLAPNELVNASGRKLVRLLSSRGLYIAPGKENLLKQFIGSVRPHLIESIKPGAPSMLDEVQRLKDFLTINEKHFTQIANASDAKKSTPGFYDPVKDLFLVKPESMKEACSNRDVNVVLTELRRLGYLSQDDITRFQSKFTVGNTRPRFYAIKRSFIMDSPHIPYVD